MSNLILPDYDKKYFFKMFCKVITYFDLMESEEIYFSDYIFMRYHGRHIDLLTKIFSL